MSAPNRRPTGTTPKRQLRSLAAVSFVRLRDRMGGGFEIAE
jgi:hypothetical protein